MLELTKYLVSHTRLPGRYLAAEFIAKLFEPANKQVEGLVGEFSYLFDFRDELQRLMYFGLYDQAEIDLMKTVLSEGDIFLDIGSNVGYYSLHASSIVGELGQVHAFEPVPENAQKLTTALYNNGIQNTCVNQVAIGETEGTFDLYLGNEGLGDSGWASIVPSKRRLTVLPVRKKAIDQYLFEKGIRSVQFVKIDVEGAEPEVIAGMSLLLKSENAPDVLCEVNPYLLEKRGLSSTAITQPLASHGYHLYLIKGISLLEVDPCCLIIKLTNLFCSKQKHLG